LRSTFKLVGVVEVVEALDLAVVEADELGLRAGLLERLARLDELHLLDAVGGEDRDLPAFELSGHVGSPFRVSASALPTARGGQTGRDAPRTSPGPGGLAAPRDGVA
jgi:hypothetical protein